MRKTKLDSMRTRQLLIDTAIEEFARRGVSNTTLTDIADAAHVTRGAIYWHFASKAELFNEIWKQEEQSRALIANDVSINENNDPLATLRNKLINILKQVATEPRYRALMEILYHKCEFTAEMTNECEIKEIAIFEQKTIAALLTRCMAEGQISARTNVNVAIILIQSCLGGIISNWLVQPERFNLYALVDVLVDNMLKLLTVDNVKGYYMSSDAESKNVAVKEKSII